MPGALLIILALATQTMTYTSVVAAPSSILLFSHGFAKALIGTSNGNLKIINKTASFSQDDHGVYAYALAEFYSANVTWNWYDPNGQLYSSSTYQEDCTSSPCYISAHLDILNTVAATRFGRWTVSLWNGNLPVYTDFFYISSVVTQENNWSFNVERSSSPLIHVNLTVTIHPNNQTWTYYQMYLPYAANLTALESGTNRTLTSSKSTGDLVVVNFGAPKRDGYAFSIIFDMAFGLYNLNGLYGGVYAFSWADMPWQRFNDPHPIYESFTVTLPKSAQLVDIIGENAITLNYGVVPGERGSMQFDATVLRQVFGWMIIYRDFTYQESHLNTASQNANPTVGPGLPLAGQKLPILPLTLGGLSIWSAVMSVFLLVSSELVSPLYAMAGSRILLNRKRLRIAGLLLVFIFLVSTAYQLFYQYSTVVTK